MKKRKKDNRRGSVKPTTSSISTKSAKKEYAYFPVHQLKSSLSSVAWSLEMLLAGSFGELSASQKEVIEKEYEEIKKTLGVANHILDAHYTESDYYLCELVPCDIVKLVQSIIDKYQYRIKGKNIAFSFYAPEGRQMKVLADPEKIKVVVENLLNNALKYTPDGGSVIISLLEDKGKALFQIKDSGIGVKESEKNKLFTKFFKGSHVAPESVAGSGMGLFIAKNIIDRHGGSIWAESREYGGSIFSFTLPIKK